METCRSDYNTQESTSLADHVFVATVARDKALDATIFMNETEIPNAHASILKTIAW